MYLAIVIVVAVGAFVISDELGRRDGPGSDRRAVYAVVAGMTWPILLIGVVEFVVIAALAEFVRSISWTGPERDIVMTISG